MQQDFPGGPVVGNLPAYVGDNGPIPSQKDSICLSAVNPLGHKPMCLERVLHNKRSHGDERP